MGKGRQRRSKRRPPVIVVPPGPVLRAGTAGPAATAAHIAGPLAQPCKLLDCGVEYPLISLAALGLDIRRNRRVHLALNFKQIQSVEKDSPGLQKRAPVKGCHGTIEKGLLYGQERLETRPEVPPRDAVAARVTKTTDRSGIIPLALGFFGLHLLHPLLLFSGRPADKKDLAQVVESDASTSLEHLARWARRPCLEHLPDLGHRRVREVTFPL
jgi:hypothetical protein